MSLNFGASVRAYRGEKYLDMRPANDLLIYEDPPGYRARSEHVKPRNPGDGFLRVYHERPSMDVVHCPQNVEPLKVNWEEGGVMTGAAWLSASVILVGVRWRKRVHAGRDSTYQGVQHSRFYYLVTGDPNNPHDRTFIELSKASAVVKKIYNGLKAIEGLK